MSAANNTSKSGSKSCSSPDDYYEDELVTWLQYPLGDSIEKGYCSDLFGQWPSSSTSMAMPPASTSASRTLAGAHASAGLCAFSEDRSIVRSDCAPASCDTGNSDAKERVGSGSTMLRANGAEGALALGAERAAGLVSLTGRDAFNKVRTAMQPPAGSQLTPSSTSNAIGLSDQLLRSKSMASPGVFNSKLPPQSPQGRFNSPSKPLQSLANYGASASSSLGSAGKGALSHSMSFTSYRSRSNEAHPQMPSTQNSGCSHVTEEMNAQRASDHASSANSGGHASAAQLSGAIVARFPPLAVEGRNQRTTALGTSEIALASSSCRSLSGTTLSTREASSYSGKRKLEDSESQSEDVEGESSMDVKQPRKASSSKRNRAAEVHNLSERNRRNRINEKLKALQDLIPNSSKTDKASVLDEAIEYMKTLQMQLQMVSMRSGLSVSPMMIPLGMPHLQMAPLHPVGLGVPVGHPGLGMGMGLHMSMGMGMMDVSQGLLGRPPQPIAAHVNHFSMPFQGRTGSQECNLDSTNMGSVPSQFMPSTQTSSQLPTPMHLGFHTFSNAHMRQQHEHWRPPEHHSEPGEHYHEQVGKEE